MKGRLIFILWLLCFATLYSYAQNLVPNPSFEEYTSCPDAVGEIDSVIGWSSFRQSPDYFNGCADLSSQVSVPNSAFGYQQPASGNAFIGLICYSTTALYREYIGCPLSSSLQIGSNYHISLKVNMAQGGSQGGSTLASNRLGVKFTTSPYSYSNPIPIDNLSNFRSSIFITDTLNWITIAGSFVADSEYLYMSIGNFDDDAHTDTIHLYPNVFRSYYFVDDVCVSTDSLLCATWTDINSDIKHQADTWFSVYPNPVGYTLFIKNNSFDPVSEIVLATSTGQKVYSEINANKLGSMLSIDVSNYLNGLYFLTIKTRSVLHSKKVIISH